MQLDEFFDYKNRMMHDLLTNMKIVKLLDPTIKDADDAFDKLAYKKVFPFDYIPETIEDAGTFICFDVDIQKVMDKTFLKPTITVWLFSHKSLLRLDEGGVRTDKLCAEIARTVNGSKYYGLGVLDLYAVKRYAPIADYQGKIMTFITKDFNNPSPSKHPTPSNRKKW